MDIIHVCGPQGGSAWAIGPIVTLLIVGGTPLAGIGLLSAFLTRRFDGSWPPPWRRWFLASFVVQISSVAVSIPPSLLFALGALVPSPEVWDVGAALVLSVNVVGGSAALVGWRQLMAAVAPDTLPSVVQ